MDHGGDIDVEEFTDFLNGNDSGTEADNSDDSDDESRSTSPKDPASSPKQDAVVAWRQFKEGEAVEARYGGKRKWFRAVIVKIHKPKLKKKR